MSDAPEMHELQIFTIESAQWHGQPLHTVIPRFLQRQGAGGVTVVRGIAGFGSHNRLHQASLVDIGADLPLVIIWIDRAERVARLRPQLEAMTAGGLIVSFPVTVSPRRQPLLEHFPHDRRARDVMTASVLAVDPDAPLADVAEIFLQSSVRTIPVVDGQRRVVGIITDGDLLRRGQIALPLSIREALEPQEVEDAIPSSELRARDVMTRDVVSVLEDLPIAAAIDVMAERGFKRLPVLDVQQRLAGILSRSDILQTVAHIVPHAAPHHTPMGAIQHVRDVMQTELAAVSPDTPLPEVVEALAEVEQRRVVVVDANRHVVGIITDGDLIRRASAEERPGIVRRLVDRLRGSAYEPERYLVVSGRAAADAMTTPVVTISEDAKPSDAIRLMLEHRVKRLPVLDADGRVVGLIGRAGVLHALSEAT